MLVVLAIASILLSAALPSWQSLLRNQSLKAAASQWMASLQRARATAMRGGTTVDIVATQPGNWNQGWVLARDANSNGMADHGEERLYAYGPIADAIDVSLHFGGKALGFQANGRPLQSGHVLLSAGTLRRKLVINMLGRPRLCDPDAQDLSC